jgi:hypothetical protein
MVSALLLCAGTGAYALDSTSKVAMSKGAMSHDGTSNDAASHEVISKGEKAQRAKAAKRPWLAHDGVSKSTMADDAMKK